ncbi:FAD-dependent oxidoreductase [Chloroflexota bacterium]
MSSKSVQNIETDILIIGAGGAGLAAAVAAREKGAEVTVLEKRGMPGGNSAMAMGFFAAESKPQKRMKIDAPGDELFKMHMDFTHWRVNPLIVRSIINISGDTVQWLEDMGVTISDVPRFYPNQHIPTYHMADKNQVIGKLIVKALAKKCDDLGVRLLNRTAAKKMLIGENGEVTGVLASTQGEEFMINARSIVLSTGGYGGNKKLLRKYYPYYREEFYMAGLPLMGDGFLMAMEIGAATEGLGVLLIGGPTLGTNTPKFPCLSSTHQDPTSLWVNKKGARFVDESASSQLHTVVNALLRQPDKTCYSLFDDRIVQEAFKEEALGDFSRYRGHGAKRNGLKKEIELALEKNGSMLKVSDSWDEISQWIDASPEILKTTIDEYNSLCDRGYDSSFIKDKRYLQALRNPPFYAVKCLPRFSTTMGGIKINHLMEVLNHNDDTIPGLYAGGDVAGGWEYDTYDVQLTGFAFGFAINSGRIAGENAAGYILGK